MIYNKQFAFDINRREGNILTQNDNYDLVIRSANIIDANWIQTNKLMKLFYREILYNPKGCDELQTQSSTFEEIIFG